MQKLFVATFANFNNIKNNKMKRILSIVLTALISMNSFAGNSDRLGESGAPELIMNGWARSTGMWDLNTSRVMGIDAMRLNPAGLSFTKKMDVALAYTQWWAGSNVALYQLGFATKLGDDNVVGVSLMSLDPGDIYRTTTDSPDPNNSLGSFRPSYFNIGLTFSRSFSSRIHGGITVRLISESAESVNAFGFALDAGLQYVMGEKEDIRFGVSVRNLGTPMKFRGDGFSFRGNTPEDDDYLIALQPGTNEFQLPSLLTLGASYDLWMGNEFLCNGGYNMHRITFAGSYISNSMGKDNFGLGIEYGFKEMFMARVGYRYEDGIFNPAKETSFNSGLAAGFSVEVPFKAGGPTLGIDYSFRHTKTLVGTHSLGLGFKLGDAENNPCLSTKDKVALEGKDAFKDEKTKKATTSIVAKKSTSGKTIKISKKEQAELERISAAVNFETGSSNLTAASKTDLDALILFMDKRGDARIQINAYTDTVGDEDSNLSLSRERAYAVKTYLINKGILKDRLKSKGYGESETFDNTTEEGRAQNRRVEITIR